MQHRPSIAAQQREESVSRGPRLLKVPRDFPTIQQAFDAAKGGDGVFIAPGRYLLTEPLMITKPLHVIAVDEVGQSAEVAYTTDLGHMSALRVDAGADTSVRIKGLKLEFRQKNPATPAIQLSSGNVILDECSVTGLEGCSSITVGKECYATLTCVKCVSGGGCGVRVLGKAFVDRCELSACDVGAINVGAGRLSIRGTLFSDCRAGVVAAGACDVLLASTAFARCTVGVSLDVDLHAGNGKLPEIKGCEFVDCVVGVDLSGPTAGCGVYKNYIHGCTVAGIRVLEATQRVEIKANAIKQCPGDGIVLANGAATVESNTLDGMHGAGVVICGGRPIVRLNEIVRCNALRSGGSAHAPTATPFRSVALLVSPCTHDDLENSRLRTEPLSKVLVASHRQPPRATSPDKRATNTPRPGDTQTLALPPSPTEASGDALTPLRAAHDELLLVDPSLQPDPLFELNMLGENCVNVVVLKGVGTYVKNELLPALEENILVEGAVGRFQPTFRLNEILGTCLSDGVIVGPGARLRLLSNNISNCPMAGILLQPDCAAAEITGNVIKKCQIALIAMPHSHGKIVGNTLSGLQILWKGDAVANVLASENIA